MAVKKVVAHKSVLARESDGTLQLTLTIPLNDVAKQREEAVKTLTAKVEVPGFRKGKVPRDVALKHIEKQDLYNQLLGRLLPEAYTKAVEEHGLKPILAPRFELVSLDDSKDWVVRAVTCELPTVEVGDYKKTVKGNAASTKIWVPGKDGDKDDENKEVTREEKEQQALKALIESAQVQIPRLFIEEEVNHKLSRLLEQTQQLGLTIEQYLASTGKTVQDIKGEFAQTAAEAVKLELVLNKIAEEEKITVEEAEIDAIIESTGNEDTKKALSTPQQRQMINSVLRRRKALDRLVNLI
ncbi:MAG: hypothetical protein HYU80_03300 [Candidatus Blackburnbacteria bacterium]|nr:hypothetical protein [Candidatus Blackburnbacteria bacterium]